ncbi:MULTISPECIES: hypothetical protein [Thermoactinomyces]|jgi:hypothetical protein|uniref:hypothetical protein n=1 Tax=Thermoactinomyces TaxID=2023 RepID=UPI00051A5FAA|nr:MULTISPECIES: hypothetical protein [Thermoactinomyces]MBH8598983.1 hypothetical protein [Thermoactinomyces sp. CICC 10523]MBH8604969.1 hypothetical protein [Thermoactinomyces sp. CICC 10522]MBH8608409.1 hypothetical protein [Thermoactinomyces sp. CICC 10521]
MRERLAQRLGKDWSGREIEQVIRDSRVLLETKTHLYLYHEGLDLRFPCVKDGETWVVKSVIVQGMGMEAQEE